MEELLVFALLLCEGIMPEDEYWKRLDELFLESPEDDNFLYLEWETDIKKAIAYIRTNIDYTTFDYGLFGKILMEKLRTYYEQCLDIKSFSERMYLLWEDLPFDIQDKQPFYTLCYADDPLSWGDKEQTRRLYEGMLNYYLK